MAATDSTALKLILELYDNLQSAILRISELEAQHEAPPATQREQPDATT